MLHCATAAYAVLAADVGAGKGQFVTQKIGEILPAVDFSFNRLAVDDQSNFLQVHSEFRHGQDLPLFEKERLGEIFRVTHSSTTAEIPLVPPFPKGESFHDTAVCLRRNHVISRQFALFAMPHSMRAVSRPARATGDKPRSRGYPTPGRCSRQFRRLRCATDPVSLFCR